MGQILGWTVDRELSAQTVELLSAVLAAFVRANADPKRRRRLPGPIRIPRPSDKPTVVSRPDPVGRVLAIARMLKRRG